MKLDGIDLNKLAVFASVVDAGGVSAAARRAGVTRSAVSQTIAALERSLGLSLFHRIGRGLRPTREGELLHARFAQAHGALARALDELGERDRTVRGTVRLGSFLGFPRPMLARLIARCQLRHPAARFQVAYGPQEDLRDRLLSGRLDFAFSFRPGPGERSRLLATALLEQELVLVAARDHLRGRFAVDDLAHTPVIDYYRTDPLIERWIRHHGGGRRVVPDIRVFAATTDLVLELVLARVGVAVLPRALVAPHLARRRLHAISTARPELRDTIWLLERAAGARDNAQSALREVLVEELRRA